MGGTIDVDVIGYLSTTASGTFFKKASPIIRRAIWNYFETVRDGSFGVHNAAYTIQALQGTYKALGMLTLGQPTSFTYKTDFPNATLR